MLSAGLSLCRQSPRLNLAKSVSTPCLIASIGASLEVAACSGTELVDRAGYRARDFNGQRDTADRASLQCRALQRAVR
jgi:hypothetical protein